MKPYWDDPYKTEFETTIKSVSGEKVILESTYFYPEGGGQESDQGILLDSQNNQVVARVKKVYSENGMIVHLVKWVKQPLEENTQVKGIIDFEKRYALMRAHTAQHLVSAVFVRSQQNPTSKAVISPDSFKIELEHPVSLQSLQVTTLEANQAIFANLPVTTEIVAPEQAAKKQTRSKMKKTEEHAWRIVHIQGMDATYCGGTHLRETREIGTIIPVKHGKTWVEYHVGLKASQTMSQLASQALLLTHEFKTDYQHLAEYALKHYRDKKNLEKTLLDLQLSITRNLIEKAVPQTKHEKTLRLVKNIPLPKNQISKALPEKIQDDYLLLVLNEGFIIISSHKHDLKQKQPRLQSLGLKGGGSNTFSQYKYSPPLTDDLLDQIMKILAE